jgi:hypothetical protein
MHNAHSHLSIALERLQETNQTEEALGVANDALQRLIGQLRFDLDGTRLQLTHSQIHVAEMRKELEMGRRPILKGLQTFSSH